MIGRTLSFYLAALRRTVIGAIRRGLRADLRDRSGRNTAPVRRLAARDRAADGLAFVSSYADRRRAGVALRRSVRLDDRVPQSVAQNGAGGGPRRWRFGLAISGPAARRHRGHRGVVGRRLQSGVGLDEADGRTRSKPSCLAGRPAGAMRDLDSAEKRRRSGDRPRRRRGPRTSPDSRGPGFRLRRRGRFRRADRRGGGELRDGYWVLHDAEIVTPGFEAHPVATYLLATNLTAARSRRPSLRPKRCRSGVAVAGRADRARRPRRDGLSPAISGTSRQAADARGDGAGGRLLFVKILPNGRGRIYGFRWRNSGVRALCCDKSGRRSWRSGLYQRLRRRVVARGRRLFVRRARAVATGGWLMGVRRQLFLEPEAGPAARAWRWRSLLLRARRSASPRRPAAAAPAPRRPVGRSQTARQDDRRSQRAGVRQGQEHRIGGRARFSSTIRGAFFRPIASPTTATRNASTPRATPS